MPDPQVDTYVFATFGRARWSDHLADRAPDRRRRRPTGTRPSGPVGRGPTR